MSGLSSDVGADGCLQGFFFESSYEACDAAVQAVAWGLSIAGCVVWVHAICWLLGGAVVFRVQHRSGLSSIICLHLLVFKCLACSPIRPFPSLGDVRGWGVLEGALQLFGRLEGCGVGVMAGVREVVLGCCVAM